MAAPFLSEIKIGGQTIKLDALHSVHVDYDIDKPAMARIVIPQKGLKYDSVKMGSDVSIKGVKSSTQLFQGKVIGSEINLTMDARPHVEVRALDAVYWSLMRGPESIAYVSKEGRLVGDIITEICGKKDITVDVSKMPSVKLKHVYQDNETAHALVARLLRRFGCYMMVDPGKDGEKSKLVVAQLNLGDDSGIKLISGGEESEKTLRLTQFTPYISASKIAADTQVYCWDPELKKQRIIGKPKADSPALVVMGKGKSAQSIAKELGKEIFYYNNIPDLDQEQADLLATSIRAWNDLTLLTAEAVCSTPSSEIQPGKVVAVEADTKGEAGQNAPVNGPYLVLSTRARFNFVNQAATEFDLSLARNALEQV